MAILVTGGAGYIGTHTVVELLNAGQEVIIVDNLSNSSVEALARVHTITGKDVTFYQGDILNKALLQKVFVDHSIESVIHFAGLKAVGESVAEPLKYYENNVTGTIILCQVMAENNVKNLVFSSSATVYGDPASLPIKEDFPTGATNPYGQSKLMVEYILADLYNSDNSWNIARLRYFNPVGAHESGLIGEDPNDIPNNLMPFIAQVAVGKREKLSVFGDDYDTPDGTGVRDYIHVVDLAVGHLQALKKLQTKPGLVTYNLGTGIGYSVLDMVKAFETACGKTIAYQISPRRPGDIAACYADPSFAATELNWRATHTVEDMANSSWKWQSHNPDGYKMPSA
ncbi:UDP-glucose 4-epimerase GalE [Shewanella sp. SR43-4]|jgi:UDP-glucose 4-epimerase|uniref:UDP-glucose 4-epimerase n=1 Tax=Shewanella vesiculosa TaxID=518738 RepID=A0ABV0FLK1_9GAMM|nr:MULTISPECIES: UDP-glucose 4-epimerase GalE [Shewanella]NCQ46599.1 UDP-glucose 4-epimerase GalE [Shewanella frigidimarina]MBB1319544.1 UDP-glucose 4-epimerase GalE [Shewanella sp. SR43-4]MBB1320002.1 UDP-glucose 4-epimerase GalE [Shewanella sp. SR43-8]MBB1477044.1 UDP-glucose 4-epimerase GalE [Shewanella sp. SG41-3]NCO72584.1 UDP-glucose 4-epimerase GalE [Shewanella vesiculosa]|tara:strand:+ start:11956 stop:12978 length:1023 start_codon:yes stop_codon:yes gene_type:complete